MDPSRLATNVSNSMASNETEEQFKARIANYRKNRRLLIVNNVNNNTKREIVEGAILARLTDPDIPAKLEIKPDHVRMFWPPTRDPIKRDPLHDGQVLLGFETRQDMHAAEEKLGDWKFRTRVIRCRRAKQHEVCLCVYSLFSSQRSYGQDEPSRFSKAPRAATGANADPWARLSNILSAGLGATAVASAVRTPANVKAIETALAGIGEAISAALNAPTAATPNNSAVGDHQD